MTIPKKVIQIWLQGEVNKKYKENILKLNPDYQYKFFQEKDCLEFLRTHYPPIICECFNRIKKPAHKSDLFRYCYLYKKGGIYLDVDLEPLYSFDKIIEDSNNADFITAMGSNSFNNMPFGECTNGFLMTVPNNQLFKELVGFILKNINPSDYGYYVKHLYKSLNNPKPFEQFEMNNMKCYLFRELFIEEPNYIVNRRGYKIINSNGNDY
jgi:mannosyltransferase OCH1-like enzyme